VFVTSMVVDIGFLPAEIVLRPMDGKARTGAGDRELGVTGKRRIFAPLYNSCTALPRDEPAALLPPPGSQLPHRILRSRPGVGSSVIKHVVTRL
jgi:hypothetical protein